MSTQTENGPAIVVSAIESNTPIGLTMEQTAAAIRAGVSGFKEYPGYSPITHADDDSEDLVTAASLESIADYTLERLFELVTNPLTRMIESSGLNRKAISEGGLYFALPQKDVFFSKVNLKREFLDELKIRLALPASKEFGGVITGSTGVFTLIERASEKLRNGELSFCIIVAVDSFLLHGRLKHYDEGWRIISRRNPAGFIPGEGCVALLLETQEHAQGREASALLRIDGLGSGLEPNSILEEKSSTGSGLTGSIRAVNESIGNEQPWKWVLSDLNGERYKAYEWGITLTRLSQSIAKDHQLSLIADAIGDTGAATAAMQIGCVCEAFKRGYAPQEQALIIAGNDKGNRAAMAVSKITSNPS